jgi:hypothetical protein
MARGSAPADCRSLLGVTGTQPLTTPASTDDLGNVHSMNTIHSGGQTHHREHATTDRRAILHPKTQW